MTSFFSQAIITASVLILCITFAQKSTLPFTFNLDWGSIPLTLLPLIIFGLRTVDLTLSTLRMLFVVRGRRASAWIFGLLQAIVFITGIAGVLGNLKDPLNLIAYAGGFATGSVLGMVIEFWLAPGHSLLRITSAKRGRTILELLHEEGRGATEISGQGKLGMVSLIFCFVPRRYVDDVKRSVVETDPEAFVTVEHVRQLRGGWRA
ncbi:MAG: DUF2179 domain-containing protein [Anaerolineaceae bacterium]|nr:MAG: DUF2179 domain-containing protein [Anaerolineaceae bacterium]